MKQPSPASTWTSGRRDGGRVLPPSRRAQRGTLIVITMIFCSLLGIALTSYVVLNSQSLKLAQRSFFGAEAMNMAEAGMEEALWSFNQTWRGEAGAWDGWTISGNAATRTFTDFSLPSGASGSVKVYVDRYNPPAAVQPKVLVEASVRLPTSDVVLTKTVEAKIKRRSYFAAGLVAKNSLKFSGNNASVDSWISDPDNDSSTAVIPYDAATNRRDKGSVGATAVTATIAVGNADIFGTAAVGDVNPTAISVGSNGKVGPFGTGNGVKDPANVATDFSANMEIVSNPTGGTTVGSIGATLGTAGTTTMWRTGSLNHSVTIYGNVTLVLTAGPGTQAVNLTGIDQITIAAGSTLTIYTEGDVKIAGNGLLNGNSAPDTFQLWGTSTSPTMQDIQIAGNGALKGIVYAPNGDIKINGDGDVMGAVVGEEITLTGNALFHYDESLANWGANTPFGIYRWREITSPTEKASFATLLAF